MNSTEKLKKLLVEYDRLIGEKKRHEKLAVDLQAEENRLMETVDIENKIEFEKVSQVRLKREMVPKKIKNFGDAADVAEDELDEEFIVVIVRHLSAIDSKLTVLQLNIAKNLESFFPKKTEFQHPAERIVYQATAGAIFDTEAAAHRIVQFSTDGSFLVLQRIQLKSTNFTSGDVRPKCRQLIEMVDAFDNLKI